MSLLAYTCMVTFPMHMPAFALADTFVVPNHATRHSSPSLLPAYCTHTPTLATASSHTRTPPVMTSPVAHASCQPTCTSPVPMLLPCYTMLWAAYFHQPFTPSLAIKAIKNIGLKVSNFLEEKVRRMLPDRKSVV